MKFAVIATGGKQYTVTPGQTIKIERLSIDDLKVGDAVVFDKVLLLEDASGTKIGKPFVSGATVGATLTEIGRNAKITIIKFKAKSRYTRRQGHRQHFMKVTINK